MQSIPLARVDRGDTRFRLSPLPPATREADRPELAASLRRVGLLQPPLVLAAGQNNWPVVAGHSRLQLAALVLGLKELPALVLPAACTPRQALAVALEALLARRHPTPMETAIFCHKMLSHEDATAIATAYLPRLGYAPTSSMVHRLAQLAAIETPLAAAIQQGRLQEKVAWELLELPQADRLALFELIDTLRLSVGNQKKLVNSCRELAGREQVTVRRLLEAAEIQTILGHPKMNPPQQSAALLEYLTARRFPRLTAAQKEFAEFRQGLKLPAHCQLEPTPSFEDERLHLTITLPNRQILQERLPALLANCQ
ncbi:MAG: ParB/RepB/Spo0J family partition protein [Desulfurivibrio sp.]|nr:ParB/RepB/Spo0J family partition protein [Desulfurivibrio sp.]